MSLSPLTAWCSIKERLRDRMPAEDWKLCIEPAQLLRSMVGPHSMFLQAPALFIERRGGDMVLLSPVDYAWLEYWADREISSVAVMRGIDAVFERYRSRPFRPPVNSLNYCKHEIYRACELMKEASVGAIASQYSTVCQECVLPDDEEIELAGVVSWCPRCGWNSYREGKERQAVTVHLPQPEIPDRTLLIGLPRNGKVIRKARCYEDRIQSVAGNVDSDLRVALTVQPDEEQLYKLAKFQGLEYVHQEASV